jgi:hypothetical protein
MNKQFALIFAAIFTSIIVMTITSVAHAQVEEQEGDLAGKIEKLQ